MNFHVRRAQQVVAVTPNSIGMCEEIFHRVAAAGVDVHSFTAYSVGSKGVFMLQCSDSEKAARVLDKSKYDVSIEEVLVVVAKSRLGTAAQVTKRLGVPTWISSTCTPPATATRKTAPWSSSAATMGRA